MLRGATARNPSAASERFTARPRWQGKGATQRIEQGSIAATVPRVPMQRLAHLHRTGRTYLPRILVEGEAGRIERQPTESEQVTDTRLGISEQGLVAVQVDVARVGLGEPAQMTVAVPPEAGQIVKVACVLVVVQFLPIAGQAGFQPVALAADDPRTRQHRADRVTVDPVAWKLVGEAGALAAPACGTLQIA